MEFLGTLAQPQLAGGLRGGFAQWGERLGDHSQHQWPRRSWKKWNVASCFFLENKKQNCMSHILDGLPPLKSEGRPPSDGPNFTCTSQSEDSSHCWSGAQFCTKTYCCVVKQTNKPTTAGCILRFPNLHFQCRTESLPIIRQSNGEC